MSEQIELTTKFSDLMHPTITDRQGSAATELAHPDDVLGSQTLTQAEKRAVLASWASDVRAVVDQPAMRQLDNGAVVRLDDILRALSYLDGSATTVVAPAPKPTFRPAFERRDGGRVRRG